MSKKINLFISHAGEDEQYLSSLKNLLGNRNYDVRDSSLVSSDPNNAKNPDYIMSCIRAQIKWAGKVIVLIGPHTSEKEWVNKEIKYASANGDKRIVGVYLRGAADSDVPEALNEYGHALVHWNSNKIIDALNGESIWEDSNGVPRADVDNSRGTC